MPRMASVYSVFVVLFVTSSSVHAQEIRWRHDYSAARKEAVASGKALLLDFGTEACIWCRKLDATTFRDRSIAELVNERFVAVKVDGNREARLVQSVGVQAFPTILIVSPEGKIIGRHEGYADVARMMQLLKPGASMSGRSAARPAAKPRSAAETLLAAARSDHEAGRYLACIQKCDQLESGFGTSPEATEGRRLTMAIVGSREKWKRVTAQLERDLDAAKRDLDAALSFHPSPQR